jgi:glycolate oxidase iron-sulfur subunit
MQTKLADFIKDSTTGREAESILRKCVHCGFCLATCPTYQVLGDELDSPRGRIYLIKQMLEGATVTATTRLHLDRCLSCRSCESTCPSGVEYGTLLETGRELAQQRISEPRPVQERALRWLLKEGTPSAAFAPAVRVADRMRNWLPQRLRAAVPVPRARGLWPQRPHARRMAVLAGCAQSAVAPDINAAAARVLDHLGIRLEEFAMGGCCGALRFHLEDADGARSDARRTIDLGAQLLAEGVETLVMTASGCGVFVRDYARLLADDPSYAERARQVCHTVLDLCEVVHAERATLQQQMSTQIPSKERAAGNELAFHAPCTLQHGQRIRGQIESLLQTAGYQLTAVKDPHLCCGSAGPYALLQPELATELRARKLAALTAGQPQGIATANIGCLMHLQAGVELPVRHWIEYLDAAMGGAAAKLPW